jgi:hypothetical protein
MRGAELARESVRSANLIAECHTAFAGKPAPTGDCVDQRLCARHKTCGSWLASDGVGTSGTHDSMIFYSINQPENHFLIFYRY